MLPAFVGGRLHDRTRSPLIRRLAAGTVALGLVAWAVAGDNGSYAGLVAAGLMAGLGNGVLLALVPPRSPAEARS